MNEEELFHILHKAIELINTEREESEKILILNKELGKAAEVIMKEDFYMEEGMFPITSVSRDDIKQAFNGRDDFEVVCQILDKMDDGQMEDLTSKLLMITANNYYGTAHLFLGGEIHGENHKSYEDEETCFIYEI